MDQGVEDEHARIAEALSRAGFRYYPATDRWMKSQGGTTVWVSDEATRTCTYVGLRGALAASYRVELPWVPARTDPDT